MHLRLMASMSLARLKYVRCSTIAMIESLSVSSRVSYSVNVKLLVVQDQLSKYRATARSTLTWGS